MLNSKIILCGLVLPVLLLGCTSVKAPVGSVPKRKQLQVDAYGGWLTLSLADSTSKSISGELIAVSSDSVYILTNTSTISCSIKEILSARLIFFNNQSDAFSGWTLGGSLLTISNGVYSVFSLPLMLIAGISTSAGEAKRVNYIDYPDKPWSDLTKFARFPQGLSDNIDLTTLRPRSIKH